MLRSALALVAFGLLLLALLIAVGPTTMATRLAVADPRWVAAGLGPVAPVLACRGERLKPLLATAGGPVWPARIAVADTVSVFGRQLVPVGDLRVPGLTAYAHDRETVRTSDEPVAVLAVAEVLSTVASLPLPVGLGGVEVALAGLLVVAPRVDLGATAAVGFLYRLCTYWFVLLLGDGAALYGSLAVRTVVAATPPNRESAEAGVFITRRDNGLPDESRGGTVGQSLRQRSRDGLRPR